MITDISLNMDNDELQRSDPGTKDTGAFSTRGVFSHIVPKMDFYYSLVGKKHNVLIFIVIVGEKIA